MSKFKIVKKEDVVVESLIKKNFSPEFMKKVYDVYIDDCMAIVEKTIRFDKIFTEEFGHRRDYRRIGEGTNRFVCLLDNHIIKVAYNYLAYIDNMNELAMAKKLPNELALAYETNGIILVSEYVTVMDKEDFLENQSKVRLILTKLKSSLDGVKENGMYYILGDMGMSEKNYGNWGRRSNGEIVVLDYGYLYEMGYKHWKEVARCPMCGSSLEYTSDFSELVCGGDKCSNRVKYTTLRNNFGYENIIENIEHNLNDDKYVKFDKSGKIKVEVMEKVEIEEKPREEFKMPEEIESRLVNCVNLYNEALYTIKGNPFINREDKLELVNNIKDYKDSLDEKLYPIMLSVLYANSEIADEFINAFAKKYKARYNEVYNALYKEYENTPEFIDEDEEDNFYPTEEEEAASQGFQVTGYTLNSNIDKEDQNKQVIGLEDILSSVVDDEFTNLFMADESEALNNLEDGDDYDSLDEFMRLINGEIDSSQEEIEEVEEESIDERLKDKYEVLVNALTGVVQNVFGTLSDEGNYLEGDVYRTYLPGDLIDLDYSPGVNARNILGGYKPEEFAFPLYRHLLRSFNYDMDKVNSEFEFRYGSTGSVEIPEDIYSKSENRNITISQIMERFEVKPAKHIFVNYLATELDNYYRVLDEYYENQEEAKADVDRFADDYYIKTKMSRNDSELMKEMNDAKENLEDDLIDMGTSIRNEGKKVVYRYDTEALMNDTQLKINDVIKNMRIGIHDNVEDRISNEMYKQYGEILHPRIFEPFIYGGSYIEDRGTGLYIQVRRPVLKAELTDSKTADVYKPQIFDLNRYTHLNIEHKFNKIFRDSAEDITELNDTINKLESKGLYYSAKKTTCYLMRQSNDMMKYLLTDNEIEILNEYQSYADGVKIKDKGTSESFDMTLYHFITENKETDIETDKFFKDMIVLGFQQALANRSFKINVLELSGSMTRIDYLKAITR